MADDDEIDILGDFSFNSCLAQNSQGIPSCSDREDTVHPQWLLDSTATNWYDTQKKNSNWSKDGPSRKLSGNNITKHQSTEIQTMWTPEERDLLNKEMEKHGRNVNKISQTLKTKTTSEIQALIEAEHGVNLDIPILGMFKNEEYDSIPVVVQEEVVMDELMTIRDTLNMVTTAHPTIPVVKNPFKKKHYNIKSNKSLLKPNVLDTKETTLVAINPTELFYEDDLIIGSTESIGAEMEVGDAMLKNLAKQHKEKVKSGKKIGNHRRKVSRNYDKSNIKSRNKEFIKSPQQRQRNDSGVSDDSGKSPKMQIVLGSGQALPLSEGEQVIKIEKKKDSEPESDIEIDIDSDKEENSNKKPSETLCATNLKAINTEKDEALPAVSIRKFEPMPKRRKKINLDGGGGCTIMHTPAGDLYEVAAEPRRERAPKKAPIHLLQCRVYNVDKPAPCEVSLKVSALVAMDAHAHTSRGEVMGLLGGEVSDAAPAPRLLVAAYCRAAAANARTHCDMDPVSQARAAEALQGRDLTVCGWHHSHPAFPAAPSGVDLRSQRALQAALERGAPFLAFITSQHWPPGRHASHYRCIHVEEDASNKDVDTPVGYQLSVKLIPDLTEDNLEEFLPELHGILLEDADRNELSVDMSQDVCPQAGITYLEKLLSSICHHMRSAGYEERHPVTMRLLRGIREVFR
ncbi:histone H2A deubiquitinase MYSM1-like [Battus philenor]|uniref:histone H2A deubiquitinase MYSM1-like n=1 Tax=Battus philenor TaxID=42288 RepID=UPI0035D06FA3